jgi:hypothetical protein
METRQARVKATREQQMRTYDLCGPREGREDGRIYVPLHGVSDRMTSYAIVSYMLSVTGESCNWWKFTTAILDIFCLSVHVTNRPIVSFIQSPLIVKMCSSLFIFITHYIVNRSIRRIKGTSALRYNVSTQFLPIWFLTILTFGKKNTEA